MIDDKLTQQAIDKLLSTPQCLQSVKNVPCDDYQSRFGAFIRVKCGIITLSAVDWPNVAQAIESAI